MTEGGAVSGSSRGPGLPAGAGEPREGELMHFKDRVRVWAHGITDPITGGLVAIGVQADHLTVFGLLLSLAASLAFFEGGFRFAALLMSLAGVCDILDGQVARRRGTSSRFGAFFDSTLDRLADSAVLAGIAGFYLIHLVDLVIEPQHAVLEIGRGLEPSTWARVSLVATTALIGSFMVSYTRARAEGLGLECKVGWFERPERMLLLIVAALFGVGPVMPGALIVLAVLSFVTATQRVAHVWKITRGAGMDR